MDMSKSITQLHGLPQQLMQQAGAGARKNQKQYQLKSMQVIWGRTLYKNKDLNPLLQQCLEAVTTPIARVLRPSSALQLMLSSDASDKGPGEVGRGTGVVGRGPG